MVLLVYVLAHETNFAILEEIQNSDLNPDPGSEYLRVHFNGFRCYPISVVFQVGARGIYGLY